MQAGWSFRTFQAVLRARLVEDDLIECVLGLGPNLFYNSPMEACVVVCRPRKPPERRGRILFINAVRDVTRERAQSFLDEGHIQRILTTYRAFTDVPGYARVATLEEIRATGANLSIPLYVRPAAGPDGAGADGPALAEAIAAWQASSAALRASMAELLATLDK